MIRNYGSENSALSCAVSEQWCGTLDEVAQVCTLSNCHYFLGF